jgi:hypothetical protein
LDKNLLDFI